MKWLYYFCTILLIFSIYSCNKLQKETSANSTQEFNQTETTNNTQNINRPVEDPKWTTKWDSYFRKYSKRFFGVGFANIRDSWLWWKSQAIAESALKKNAESWVGAKGLMQVMPETFSEIRNEINIPKEITSPRWNIAAGIYYDKKMWNIWSDPRPLHERLKFTFASYNGGAGNILKAQKLCETKCNYWGPVKERGENVDSWRQKETIHYVSRIFKYMGEK